MNIKTGWWIVTGTLAALLLAGALGVIVPLLMGREFDLLAVGRYAFEVWLCWQVYQGIDWARLVLGMLLLLNGAGLMLAGATAIGAITLILMVMLFVVPQANAYFSYAQRQ